MRNYLLDSNILITLVRNTKFEYNFHKKYSFRNNNFLISVVTEGELLSLSIQRNWGLAKIKRLETILSNYIIYPIKVRAVIDTYAQIDAYSQGKLFNHPLPHQMSARNMGKNDLWIAATAHVTNATLITTDKDFDHLNKAFINLDRISNEDFV